MDTHTIPLGYMLKSVVQAPDWMGAPSVRSIHSVSGCVSPAFMDYIPLFRHNGWWLFDSAEAIRQIAIDNDVELASLTLFFYEAFDREYDDGSGVWRSFEPERAFPLDVTLPASKTLSGFDVTAFHLGTSPECSPLSCNGLASEAPVNERCLLETFDAARAAIESRFFEGAEPGPYRIIAVHTVP